MLLVADLLRTTMYNLKLGLGDMEKIRYRNICDQMH